MIDYQCYDTEGQRIITLIAVVNTAAECYESLDYLTNISLGWQYVQ